jgi:hypothetical protein
MMFLLFLVFEQYLIFDYATLKDKSEAGFEFRCIDEYVLVFDLVFMSVFAGATENH